MIYFWMDLGGLLYSVSNYLMNSDIFTTDEWHTNQLITDKGHNCLENMMFEFISVYR